ncbi:DUF5753 domain-containing protein [Saccharopolyspora sp. NPDC050389]|uniref:DUF5753 domain-containing protein n=1 Tax=Saccharopolyspora sp. NPDC050389 TaxID=3155516 RepID=UPI00340CA1D1
MTQEKAAAGLDMSTSALSRKESGEVATLVHEIRSMMDLFDRYDPDLLDLARAARERGWWRAYGVEDRGYVDLETEACTVRELSLMYIPGLLQTEDYMRAIFNADRLRRTKKAFENQVSVRLIRQQRLTDEEQPLRLVALLDEVALGRPIGGPDVMRDQLKNVLRAAENDQVELRVIGRETGPHAGMEGSFISLSFPESEDQELLYIAYRQARSTWRRSPRCRKLV